MAMAYIELENAAVVYLTKYAQDTREVLLIPALAVCEME